MINLGPKISFTSNVYVFYKPYDGMLNKYLYQNKEFIRTLDNIKNNKKDETVLVMPYDHNLIELQVSKKINNKTYSQTSYFEANSKDFLRAYSYANQNLELVQDDEPIVKYLA